MSPDLQDQIAEWCKKHKLLRLDVTLTLPNGDQYSRGDIYCDGNADHDISAETFDDICKRAFNE